MAKEIEITTEPITFGALVYVLLDISPLWAYENIKLGKQSSTLSQILFCNNFVP